MPTILTRADDSSSSICLKGSIIAAIPVAFIDLLELDPSEIRITLRILLGGFHSQPADFDPTGTALTPVYVVGD